MRILLLSAYDAVSHRYWRKGLVEQFPEHQWTTLTLPDRYFNWRFRGNSLSWAMGERQLLSQEWDRVIATSMTDLSALRGMVPQLARVPATVYFHENQFAYPRSEHQSFSPVEQQLQTIYTALCGENLVFNTEFNRSTFLQGATTLLNKLPDHVPANIVQQLEQRSCVIPVALANDVPAGKARNRNAPLLIGWAARWEYDKGPDRLLAILEQLEQTGLDYRLCIMGQAFRKQPKEFDCIGRDYQHRLSCFGYAESRKDYLGWLGQCDLFLSTSRHEFQGISVLEAVACGAVPVLPDEQSYPCLFDKAYLYQSVEHCITMILQRAEQKLSGTLQAPDTDHFRWTHLRRCYETVL